MNSIIVFILPHAFRPRQVVELQREAISLSPVYATMLPHVRPDGSMASTGYIRLAAFSQNAAKDMSSAIKRLEGQGATNYILDLRNNPGETQRP